MDSSEYEVLARPSDTTATRRALLHASLGGFALAASGLFLPTVGEKAEAREGALGGKLGGRHGKDHKGRHRHRSHGDKKDKAKRRDDAPPKGHEPFRTSALTVVNNTSTRFHRVQTLRCTFYYRIETGPDEYGLPVASGDRTLGERESYRYDPVPGRHRVGVRIKRDVGPVDIYVEVRNTSSYPRASMSEGSHLDPSAGKMGFIRIRDEIFVVGEKVAVRGIVLERKADSDTCIEWQLSIGEI